MQALVCRNGNYYFRLRVPFDLKPHFNRNEFLKSLHTGKYQQAKSLVRCLIGKAERVFTMLRSKTLDADSVYKLVRDFVASTLELKYDDGPDNLELHETILGEMYDEAEIAITRAVKTKDYVITHLPFTGVSAEYLCWAEGIDTTPETMFHRRLEHELAVSKLDIIQTLKERLATGDSAYDKEMRKQEAIEYQAKEKSNTLSEAIAVYCKPKNADGRGKVKLNEIMKKIMECFEYESGKKDILLSEIDYDLTNRVGQRLLKYPAYRNVRYKNMTLNEIYTQDSVQYSSVEGTVKSEIYRLTGIYNCAITKLDGLKKNYANGLAETVGGKSTIKASAAKDVFRQTDIQEIVRVLDVFKNKGEFKKNPHLLYITLMGLFTGARINEICQLNVDDIHQVGDIWCIRHEETTEDKSLKTANSIRVNPIHPTLIELGLLRFRDSQIASGRKGLWEGSKNHNCDYYEKSKNCSHYVSKWWNGTFKSKLKLSNPSKQTFHSTRHTFVNWFYQNIENLDFIARNALTGHLDKDDIAALDLQGYDRDAESELTYTKNLNVPRQLKTLDLLDYGIDFGVLI